MKRLVVAVAAVVLVLGAVSAILARSRGVSFVETRIAAALDRPIELDGARWAWPAGLDADRIVLTGTGAFSRADILVAEDVSVRQRPLSLVVGALEASSVAVGDLLVRIHHEDGAITHPLSTSESKDSPLTRWTDHVRTLRIENGTVEFYDHDAPLFYEGDELRMRFEARLRDVSADVRTDPSGEVKYGVTGDLDLGPSHPTGQVDYAATTAADTGTTTSRLRVDDVPLRAFNGYLRTAMTGLEDGRMTIEANTSAVDGVWTTSARVDMTDLALSPVQTAGTPSASQPSSSLLQLFADPSGASSLDVAFTWDRNNRSQTFQQALGQGIQTAIRDRMVANVPNILGGLLGAFVEGASGADDGSGDAVSPLQGLLDSLESGGR